MSLLQHPLPSVQAYVQAFSDAPLPVLRHTVRAFNALRESGENVGARHLSAVVIADPLMTMRLLTHLERHRRQSQNHDITTIERAIMMMGVEPFFTAFADLPTVEDALAAHPRALIGVLKVIARARRAADYAREAFGQVVVARPEAMDLVRYLQSLDRSYPVSSTVAQKGAQP